MDKAMPMFPDEGDDTMYGYMCLVDFECELGFADCGNVVYPSVESLKERRKCFEGCGIVKVAVKTVEIVQAAKDYE